MLSRQEESGCRPACLRLDILVYTTIFSQALLYIHIDQVNQNGAFSIRTAVRARLGAQKLDETSQNSLDIEEFLAGLRFEQRGKLEELTIRI